jgi:hypothetical protein
LAPGFVLMSGRRQMTKSEKKSKVLKEKEDERLLCALNNLSITPSSYRLLNIIEPFLNILSIC